MPEERKGKLGVDHPRYLRGTAQTRLMIPETIPVRAIQLSRQRESSAALSTFPPTDAAYYVTPIFNAGLA